MRLKDKADQIANDVLRVCVKNGAGHIAPSLSTVDILVALYYSVMKPEDKLIFSKAHGCYALYAILADLGKISQHMWDNFYTPQSVLSGCSERMHINGLEAGCGALGHGLPIAAGLAFGYKLQNKPGRIFCMVGDGEMQEGSNWEAIQFAVHHKLDNLYLIIDGNGLQAMDYIKNVAGEQLELLTKLLSFGLETSLGEGHDVYSLIKSFQYMDRLNKPKALYAKTVKGYRVKCMENVPKFHFRIPTEEELCCQDKKY